MIMIIADTKYPQIFHSPGLEPWILGLLLNVKPRSLLDVGCGYGFWSFIIRRRISSVSYIVGIEISSEKIQKAKTIYDVVLADARYPPFRSKSFNAVLAVEVLHGLKGGFKNLSKGSEGCRENRYDSYFSFIK